MGQPWRAICDTARTSGPRRGCDFSGGLDIAGSLEIDPGSFKNGGGWVAGALEACGVCFGRWGNALQPVVCPGPTVIGFGEGGSELDGAYSVMVVGQSIL